MVIPKHGIGGKQLGIVMNLRSKYDLLELQKKRKPGGITQASDVLGNKDKGAFDLVEKDVKLIIMANQLDKQTDIFDQNASTRTFKLIQSVLMRGIGI